MPQYYDDEFKKKIVRLKLEKGRTAKNIISEYGVSKASITDKQTTSDLAIRTLKKALESQQTISSARSRMLFIAPTHAS